MLLTIGNIHEGSRYRIKDREKALIFQKICSEEGITRKAISHTLNIRPTTVSQVIQELIDDNLVKEGHNKSEGKPGRPEFQLFPNGNKLIAISIYVEGKKLKGSLVNLKEEILYEKEYSADGNSGNDTLENIFYNLIEDLKAKNPNEGILLGVGISLVGTVNSREKIWITCARWNKIRNLDFKKLERKTGLKIKIKRALDTELEYHIIKRPEYRKMNVLLFHWGYGIGSSYAHQGKVINSALGRFAEVGHTIVPDADNLRCLCGSTGCLETVAAMWSILPLLEARYGEISNDERSFVDTLESSDIIHSDIIKTALKNVSIGLSNIFKILYPDHILFIGPFTENPEIYTRLKTLFTETLPEYMKNSVDFSVITGGFRGSIYGNIYSFFMERLKELLRMRS